jgi:hypothetical protein
MVFKLVLYASYQVRLASVLVSAAAAATALAALAALAATLAAVAPPAAPPLLYRHLRPLHRRSECPKLHSLAQLSVELRRRPGVLHRADCTRHRSAPDSDLL